MISDELDRKIKQAIRFLQSIKLEDGEQIELCYSGGKDSDVILQLAKESGINYRGIYKNTTIDPSGTIKHAKDNGCEIIQPKESFFKLVAKHGLPSRYARFCCSILKEYKILDKQIVGVRRSESRARYERYKEPEKCRTYKKDVKARQYFPILEWSDEDIAEFIADRKIKCHDLYYDEDGNFHVERRLGCMGCPLQSRKKRINEFKKNPNLLKAWIRADKKFSERKTKSFQKYFSNVYEHIYYNIFCDNINQFNAAKHTMFGTTDFKKLLEDHFKIKL